LCATAPSWQGCNKVTSTDDVTAHAEVVAIPGACAKFGTFHLSDCEISASCEPCPMCLGAIHWARFRTLYYANTRAEAAATGFDDELTYCEMLLAPAACAFWACIYARRSSVCRSRNGPQNPTRSGIDGGRREAGSAAPESILHAIGLVAHHRARNDPGLAHDRAVPSRTRRSRVGDANGIGRVEPREVSARMVPRPPSLPSHVPHDVNCHPSTDPVRLIETAPEGAFVVIMTHSHALDLDVTAAALLAGRFACVGLIGSATKRACFASTVRQIGPGDADLTHLICPVGLTEIRDKPPAAIAAAIAALLLIRRDTVAAATSPKPAAIVPSGAPHA